jgi:hypothetical protein
MKIMKIKQPIFCKCLSILIFLSTFVLFLNIIGKFQFVVTDVIGMLCSISLLLWSFLLVEDTFSYIEFKDNLMIIKKYFIKNTIFYKDIKNVNLQNTNQLCNFYQGKKIVIEIGNKKYKINISVNEDKIKKCCMINGIDIV